MSLTKRQQATLNLVISRLKGCFDEIDSHPREIVSDCVEILRGIARNKQTMLTSHFSLDEFLTSVTATRNSISLNPSDVIVSNLYDLCSQVLEPAREALGHPIFVSSGYRNASLNRLVGGAPNSYHTRGRAADISCYDNARLLEILEKLPHVELINYHHFIHVAL